jgi:hypothetical protein
MLQSGLVSDMQYDMLQMHTQSTALCYKSPVCNISLNDVLFVFVHVAFTRNYGVQASCAVAAR